MKESVIEYLQASVARWRYVISMWPLVLALLLCSDRPPAVTFARDVRPILEQRCVPCHFAGGKMYERLPFDRPETIHKLGTKLFTRIRDEKQREVIRKFLAAKPAGKS